MTLEEMNATIIEVKTEVKNTNDLVIPDIDDDDDICQMLSRVNVQVPDLTYSHSDHYWDRKKQEEEDARVLAEWRGRGYRLLPLVNDQTNKRYEPEKPIEIGKRVLVIDDESGLSEYMEVDRDGKLVSSPDSHLGSVGGE